MNNLKVRFKRLERNPESNPGNSKTVAQYLEKVIEGYVQGYINHSTFGSTAIVLHENTLLEVNVSDITVLTDQS